VVTGLIRKWEHRLVTTLIGDGARKGARKKETRERFEAVE